MAEAEFDRALDHLHENKVRLAPQRKTILNYLVNHHTHPSVEVVYDDPKDTIDNINMATVYNTLKLFVDYSLVAELKNGDDSARFNYFGHPHYHVVCDNCDKISDVFDEHFTAITKELTVMIHEKAGYLVTGNNIEVHGICLKCQRKLHLNH